MQALRIFREVAQDRSFSRAAATLGLTQSATSQRIGQLERQLGVTLIDRSVRPLTLTPPGEVFMRGCCEVLEKYEALERQVSALRSHLEGQIRVDAIYSAGIDLLNQVKTSFEVKYPRANVRVEYKRPEEVYEAVRSARCDLGIVSYPQRWRDVTVATLRDEPMVLVCPPAHPLAGRDEIEVCELNGQEMVTFDPSLPVARRLRRYFKDNCVKPLITNVFDNIDTMKTAVGLTGHLSVLPRRTVQRELSAGSLIAVELMPRLTRPLGIIHLRRNGRDCAVHTFIDFLVTHAGPNIGNDSLDTRCPGNSY